MSGALLPPGIPRDPRRRRMLALALPGALALGLGLGVVLPLAEQAAEAAEQEERQRSLLARLERLAAQGPALRRELDALDAELAGTEVVLRAPSASQAAAAFQAALRRVLEAEGVAPDSAQALPPVPEGAFLRLGLRLEMRAGIEPLSRILLALERHRPAILVREAVVAAGTRGQAGGAGVTRRDGGGAPLTIRLDLAVLAQVPPPATGPAAPRSS